MPAATSLRPPLGIPHGSVRALLTLMIVAVVVVLTVRGAPMGVLLTETLLVALAHYFTTRRLLKLPPDLMQRLEAEGHLELERHPLYLPRHSVRVIIIVTFVVLAAYMAREGRLWSSEALTTLGVVGAYFLGLTVSSLMAWVSRRRQGQGRAPAWWEDGKALLVLLVTAALVVLTITGHAAELPHWSRNTTFGLVLFYFGSR